MICELRRILTFLFLLISTMMDIWQSHPKWNELEEICVQIETLKEKAKNLREEIRKDLFEEEKSKQKGLSYE